MQEYSQLMNLGRLIRMEDCSNGMDNSASKLIREWADEAFDDTHIQLISLYDANKKDPIFVGGFLFAICQAFGGKHSLRLYQKAIIDGLSNKGYKETFTQEMAIMAIECDRSQWAYDVLKKYGTDVAESLVEYRDKVMMELEVELKKRNNNEDAKTIEWTDVAIYKRLIWHYMLGHGPFVPTSAEKVCDSLADIFANQEVESVDVDYSVILHIVSLAVVLKNGIEFVLTTPEDSDFGSVHFSIFENGELLYWNIDELKYFKENMEQYLKKINEGNSESYIRVYSSIRDAILTRETELTYANDDICRSLASIFENEDVSECEVIYRENKTFYIGIHYADGLCFTIMINDKNLNHLHFYVSKHGIEISDTECGIIDLKEYVEKRQRFNENIKKIRHTLESELDRKGQPLDDKLDIICEVYSNAFFGQNIIDLDADYGTKYGGLTLDIVVNDGLEFMVRTEKSDDEVLFSILRDNVLIYTNCSLLLRFAKKVDEFFERRKDIEVEHKRLKQYIEDDKGI